MRDPEQQRPDTDAEAPAQGNPNEHMEDGSTQGTAPGTGDPGEGAPADGGTGQTGDTSGTNR